MPRDQNGFNCSSSRSGPENSNTKESRVSGGGMFRKSSASDYSYDHENVYSLFSDERGLERDPGYLRSHQNYNKPFPVYSYSCHARNLQNFQPRGTVNWRPSANRCPTNGYPENDFREASLRFGSEYRKNFSSYVFRGAAGGPFIQRKTLLDTFITRDSAYWQNRVTLKIDVPFTDHSHIIGRGGKNTQMVMKETGCHIHFPDSNKNSDLEKSNQVSIAGPMNGVEKAREIIRSLAPLAVTFDLKNVKKDVDIGNLTSHPALEFETGTTDITVLIRPNRSSGQPFVLLRGSARQEGSIRQAFRRLSEKLFPPNSEIQCAVSLDIMPAQQETVLGPRGLNMAAISNSTRTMIHYPPSDRKGATTFYIRGTLDGILNARKQIIGFLPVSLNFELNSPPTCDIAAIEQDLNVTVSVKPKRGTDSVKCVTMKSQEWNCSRMYMARDKVTGLHGKEQPVICIEYNFMHKLQYPAQQIVHHSPNGLSTPAAIQLSPIPGMPTLAVTTTGPSLSVPLLLSPNGIAHPATILPVPNVSPLEGPLVGGNPCLATGSQFRVEKEQKDSEPSPGEEAETPKRSVTSNGIPRQLSSSEEDVAVEEHQRLSDSSEPGVDSPIAKALLDSAKGSGNWSRAIGAERREKRGTARDNMALLAHEARNRPVVGYRTPNDFFCGLGYSRSMNVSKQSMPSGSSMVAHLPPVDEVFEHDEAGDQMGAWPTVAGSQRRHRRFDLSTFERLPSVPNGPVVDSEEYSLLASLLAQNGLARFIPNFEEEQIDYSIFCSLTAEDLEDLNINTYVARKKILELIRVCNSS